MKLSPQWITLLITAVSCIGFGMLFGVQSQADCYSVSLGFTVTDAAQDIIDAQGLSLPEMQTDIHNSLNRYQQMTGQCFTGELGLIFGQLPDRVFAVFASSDQEYGLTRVMTEYEYYPEPFSPSTIGWQRSTNVLP